ncbi:hypothetical protein ACFX2I_045081 [Malus domestica]
MLLQLLVEIVNNGWCDANGIISKQTIEAKIVPALNEKLGCKKTEDHVKNRMKTLKGRFQSICQLFRHNSEFGWDPVRKKLTASDEVILYIMSENMIEEEMEREDEEYHEAIKLLLMAVQAIVQVPNVLMVIIHDDHIERH